MFSNDDDKTIIDVVAVSHLEDEENCENSDDEKPLLKKVNCNINSIMYSNTFSTFIHAIL